MTERCARNFGAVVSRVFGVPRGRLPEYVRNLPIGNLPIKGCSIGNLQILSEWRRRYTPLCRAPAAHFAISNV